MLRSGCCSSSPSPLSPPTDPPTSVARKPQYDASVRRSAPGRSCLPGLIVLVIAAACGRVGYDAAGGTGGDGDGDGDANTPPGSTLGDVCTEAIDCGEDAPQCDCGACQQRARTCCQSSFSCVSGRCGCGACDPQPGECCASGFDCASGRCGCGACDPRPGACCVSGFDCASGRCGCGRCDPAPGECCEQGLECASGVCAGGNCQ